MLMDRAFLGIRSTVSALMFAIVSALMFAIGFESLVGVLDRE